MNACRPQRGALIGTIGLGIAKRGFYILSDPDEIPACRGPRGTKLERIQEFARQNGWQATIHNGNGWVLFRAAKGPPLTGFEDGLGQLAQFVNAI